SRPPGRPADPAAHGHSRSPWPRGLQAGAMVPARPGRRPAAPPPAAGPPQCEPAAGGISWLDPDQLPSSYSKAKSPTVCRSGHVVFATGLIRTLAVTATDALARTMSIQHALLTSLLERPSSGYGLANRFDHSMGYFWHASHQQIYRELGRMAQHGWLAVEEQESGGGR